MADIEIRISIPLDLLPAQHDAAFAAVIDLAKELLPPEAKIFQPEFTGINYSICALIPKDES